MDSDKQQQKSRVIAAAIEFNARQARHSHPAGTFDKGNRWYPASGEQCECCESIRSPSRSFPYSLMAHCRTAEHVAHLFDVDLLLLKRAARALKGGVKPDNPDAVPVFDDELKAARKVAKPRVRRVWKIVALEEGRHVSVYDGSDWTPGVTRHETAKSGHHGGYYWYRSLGEAVEAAESGEAFRQAWCSGKRLVVLECEAWGRVVAYANGKYASSYLKPVRQALDLGVQP